MAVHRGSKQGDGRAASQEEGADTAEGRRCGGLRCGERNQCDRQAGDERTAAAGPRGSVPLRRGRLQDRRDRRVARYHRDGRAAAHVPRAPGVSPTVRGESCRLAEGAEEGMMAAHIVIDRLSVTDREALRAYGELAKAAAGGRPLPFVGYSVSSMPSNCK